MVNVELLNSMQLYFFYFGIKGGTNEKSFQVFFTLKFPAKRLQFAKEPRRAFASL